MTSRLSTPAQLGFALALSLLCQGCLADCSIGGTGKLKDLDDASISTVKFDKGGGISVEIAGFANETDPNHILFTKF